MAHQLIRHNTGGASPLAQPLPRRVAGSQAARPRLPDRRKFPPADRVEVVEPVPVRAQGVHQELRHRQIIRLSAI